MTTVFLVDDQEMIRTGLRAILGEQAHLTVIAEFSDGLAAVNAIIASPPDVVLMDIQMPGIDGIEATRRVRQDVPATTTRIVVLTTFEHDEKVIRALQAGADGFLGKGASPAELVEAIQEVTEGGGALSRAATSALMGYLQKERVAPQVDADMKALFATLTPRELDVVREVANGATNEEIARRSFVSPLTVKTQVHRAMGKVGARDRSQLVAFAHRAGLG